MPEGDTIFKLARELRQRLEGQALTRLWLRDRGELEALHGAHVLLDQTIAAGLGNAFKSDVLFLEGVHPATSPSQLSDATLRSLFECAHTLMRWNRRRGPRVTTRRVTDASPLLRGEPTHWVYGRAGQPCLRCSAGIAVTRVGDAARVTFACPSCQEKSVR